MARLVQLLVPLICAVFADANLNLPFLDQPGLPPSHSDPDTIYKQPQDKNFGQQSWLHHVMGQRLPGHSDGDVQSYERQSKEESYEDFNPFHKRGVDPQFEGSYGKGHFDPMTSITFPDMTNAFNTQNRKDSDGTMRKNPKEKPEVVSPSDKTSSKQGKDHKSSDAYASNTNLLPPKANEFNKNDIPEDTGDKNEKVDLNKNKDYLPVGSDNNGYNVLNENNPNLNTVVVPNANQPSSNVVYIPYYPGQNNNPVSQVVSQQPTNFQVTPNKINVGGGYNNGVASPAQFITTGNQNPGNVLVYSNGQLMQIPGVVVNQAQNNMPVQYSNPIQGTNYIITNAVPNNIPANQNPGTNVIYATLPNQGSNSPIVIQMPQCPNNVCGSGTVVQNPLQGANNDAYNIMSNNGLTSNVVNQLNQNMAVQPAILLTNGVTNGYAQPTIIPQGVNTVVGIPSQGAVLNNQNGSPQLVPFTVNSNSNQYNQPIVTSLQPNTAVNTPSQVAVNNQNALLQPAVQMPANTWQNGYNNQPVVLFQPPNVANQNQGDSNQNLPMPPSILENSGSNGYIQQQPPYPGIQGIVNTPNHDEAADFPDIDIRNPPANSLRNNNGMAIDDNSMAALGAQPAIMLSGFKETADDKNDKKTKKGKKDKSKKNNKKNKDSGESKEEKPLTVYNKKK